MKNFTAALLSCYKSVVFNSRPYQAGKKSEVGNICNYRANLFDNIFTRNFLWGFYRVFSNLCKPLGGHSVSIRNGFNNLKKFFNYFNLATVSRVYLDFSKTSIASRRLIGVLVASLIFGSNLVDAQCTGTAVGGTVFRDFNLNGVKDNTNEIGLAGVTVKAFKPDNTQIGSTATTSSTGAYAITGLSGSVRVEFSTLPTGYVSGPDGSSSGTSIQFVTLSSSVGCAINFGVNHPDDFCAKSGVQPKVAVPCYANGAYNSTGTNGAGLEDALVSFPYNRTGDKSTSGNAPFVAAKYSNIGSVWGMAYNKYNKTLFTTAFMKRHSGFGPQGISGLYIIQNADNNGSGYVITGINLQTALGINAGTQPTRNLSNNKTQPSDDGGNAVFNAVGKMSFGDCELSTDGNTLYITNLFDKKIYVLNVTNPLSPTLITSYLVPNPGCSVSSEYAPFGLKFYRGKLYVGVICTAESSQPATPGSLYGRAGFNTLTLSSSNLKATVYELNGATFTTALTQFPLNFDRGFSNSGDVSYSIWRPWVNSWSQVPSNIDDTYPQPILSDIEFDSDGSMILGFADRFSHQLGNANYPPGQNYTVTGRVEGDVMRATKSGSTWTIENNGTASGTTTSGTNKGGGPGGGEYYFGDITIDHDEPAMGGMALYPGTGEVMTTIAGPSDIFYSGGTRRINNSTGDYLYLGAPIAWNSVTDYRLNYDGRPASRGDYKLYDGDTPSTFGKASGLGDIEVFCSLAPLEIGNRIWRDYDQDGIQGADEPGIPSITVLLFKAGVQVASTATDVNGEYYFNDANVTGGLLPNMAYEIRVAIGQTNIANTFLSPTNANSNNSNEIDSDAAISGSNAIINLTTGGYGESNHTYDIGFSPNCPTLSNPQPNNGTVAVCSGTTPQLILSANKVSAQPLPITTTIEWIYFTSAQADPYTSLATKVVLTPVKPLADGTITSSFTNFPTTAGTYYVYACLKPVPNANNPNCRPFVSYVVTVNAIPGAPTAVTGGSVCKVGATATVSLSATCGTGQTAVWYTSNATTAVSIGTGTPFTSPAISVTTTYYVGCKNTTTSCETAGANRVSAVATILNTPAAPTVTILGGVDDVCGSSATLESGCATGTLKWSTGATTNQIIVLTAGTYSATCILSTCASNVSNAVTITLNNTPSMPTINGGGASICLGSSATLTASACAGTYLWSNGATTNAITATPSVTGTTNYTVSCTNNGCTSPASASASVTTNTLPNPPTAQNVVGGAVCVNTGASGTVNLTAVCGTNEIPQWYNGKESSSTFIVAGTAYSPSIAVTTTYYVGCKNTSTGCENPFGNRTPVVGTVNTNPVSPANPTISKSAICIGESVSLSATCGTNETAQWYEATTAIGTGNFTYTPTVLGAHTYSVGCKNNSTNCETADPDRGKVFLQVNPIPNTPASPTISKGDICLGETISLSATCGTNETPQWYEGTTFLGAGNITYTPTVLGSYTYTVGCKNNATNCETVAANRGKVTIQINEIPAAPTAATGGAVCGSGSINLTASCATGTTTVWYNTQNTTTSLSVGTPFSVVVTENRTYYVACRSTTSPTFCESPASSRKAVEVIFNNNPVLTVSATPNAICVGGSTKLKVNETFTTYAWKGPNGFSNSNQSVDITNIVTANAGVYTVTVSAAGGCTASATVNVTVNTNPSATASVTDNTVCQQSTIELRSSATAGTGTISSYAWTGPNTYTAGIQNPAIVMASPAMTGAYVVKVTDINGCTATSQVSVIINPLPTATASSEGGNTICLGAPIGFVASGAGIGGSYQWTGPAGSGFSETTQSPTIIATTLANAGVYTLKITNSNGCTAITTINITIDKCLRIGNLVWEDTNNNGIVDGTEAGVTTPLKVELYKANTNGTLGALVATQNTVAGKYLFSGLEPGDYIVQITAPTGYKSSTGTNGSATGAYELAPDPDNDKDNDDNGSFESGQIIRSKPVTLQNSNEPTNDGDDNNGNLTVDFGIYQPSKLGDFVFNDDNRNGQQDLGETGVAGITVNLYESSSSTIPVATATTDANGKYLFDNLKPDTYVVEFVKSTLPNDKQFTIQNINPDATDSDANVGTGKSEPVILGIGETNLTIDAGIQCPLPTPTATTTTSQVCVGGGIKLTATGGKAYSWKGPNGFSETTADVTINNAIIANTGTYTVTVTADNKCNATAMSTVAVLVNSNPTVSATGAVVCTEESINLKAQGSGTFAWKGPNSFNRTEQNPVITGATALNAGVYTVTVTNGSSCNVSTTVNVSVNERPAAPTETNKNKSNICEGETLSLSGVCATGTIIKWYKEDGITVLNPSQNFNPGPVGTYIYYAVCKNDATGCETTNNLRTKVTVVVDGIPTAVTPTISKGIICKGETVSLSAICGTNQEPVWYIGTSTTAYTGSLTLTPPVGNYTYYVSCKSKTGAFCETAAPNRKPVTLIVNDNPTASATVTDNTVCTGSTIELKGAGSGSIFVWSGPGFNRTEQNPSIANAVTANSGVYTLTVTNGSNCSATSTVSVTVLVNPVATASGNAICANETVKLESGAVLVGIGNSVTSYAWTGPNNFTSSVQKPEIANAQPNRTGTYTVLITDANGCTATATTGVTVNILPTATASSNSPVCVNSKLTLEVISNGTSYAWTGPAGSGFTSSAQKPEIASAKAVNAGVYTVVVTNGNSCSITATVNVVVNPLPTTSATGAEVCVGKPITLDATAGFTSYAWTKVGGTFTASTQSPIVTASAVTGDAGVYQVLVTNSNGCTAIATATVIVNELPVPTAQNNGPVCVGTTITLTANAGFAKYAWSASNGFSASTAVATIPNAEATDALIYTVTVTDAKGCIATATTEVKVNTNPNPTIQPIAPICSGENIVLNVSGGANDKYSWTGSNSFTSTQQNPTVSPKPTTAGIYTYFVTVEGVGGCTGTATTSVTIKALPTVTVPSISICAGVTGKLTASGATTYAWSSNTGETFTSTTADLSVTKAGIYTVIGTNEGGCTASATTTVRVNPNPNSVATSNTTICLKETVNLGITGAVVGNTYAWVGSNGFASTEQSPSDVPTGPGTVTYTVTVTGEGGCTGTATTSVIVKPNPTVSVPSITICAGTTGTLTASGADSYAWTGPEIFTTTSANLSVTQTGTYTVIGSINGCTATATTSVTVKEIPTVTVTPITLCTGVSGKLKAEGSEVDTYSWNSSNAGFSATTQEVAVSQAGTYTVFVSKNGCTAQATATVEVKPSITLTVSTASICAGTTINLTVSGASTYTWTGPGTFSATGANPVVSVEGTYTVIGTSGNCTASATTTVTVKATPTVTVPSISICGGTTGKLTASVIADTYLWTGPENFTGTTQEVTVSKAGLYSVTISKDGCTALATATVEIKTVADIKAISAEVCTGDTTTLTATGGVTYAWTGPGLFTATGASPRVSIAGTYTVTGTTEGGCIGTATATLIIKDNPTVTITGNTVICLGGKTTLTANGTGSFAWTGTDNFTATTATVDVSAGTYQVTVTNAGCTASGTVKVVNDSLSISAGGAIVCEGGSTGLKGAATATSGILSYAWSGPNGFTSTEVSPSVTKLFATGTYILSVISNAGCSATATAIITVTPAVTNTAAVAFCTGGKAILTATGGKGATYLWTSGATATTSSIEVTAAGTYSVTITDSTGCISKGNFTVTETTNPTVAISGVLFLCNGKSTELTANKGTVGETYAWTGPDSFTSTTQTITVTKEGDYNVKVVTNGGCEATGKVAVIKGFTPTIVCGPVCEGENLILKASDGLTYSWVGPNGFTAYSQNPQLLNVKKSDEGIYQVIITDVGCTATVVSTLIVYEKPTGITATAQNSTCDQDTPKNDGAFILAGIFTGLKYDIVEGATYTGTKKYAEATDIPANGIVKSGIANPATNAGTKYTVRVFNVNNCYTDYTLTIQQVVCLCDEAKCVPYGVIKTISGKK